MAKLRMICANCGSEDVLHDAYVRWNVDTQEWEISNTFDQPCICESDVCDGRETEIIEEVIEE